MEVQTAVQQLLLEHGAYAPIELLLATNRLSYKDYRAWRKGTLASLDGALAGGVHEAQALLETAQAWARTLDLAAEPAAHHGWEGNAGTELTASHDPALNGLLNTRFLRAREHGQLDLFMDSAGTVAVNALLDALRARDAGKAGRELRHLAGLDPGHAHRAHAAALVEALEAPDPEDPGQGFERLDRLEREWLPAASALLGAGGRDFLAPLWRGVGQALEPACFDPRRPRRHASWAYRQGLDWESLERSVRAVQGHETEPVLLARLAEAQWWLRNRTKAIEHWFALCRLAPGEFEKRVEAADFPDWAVGRAWRLAREQDLEPEMSPRWFPAWMLLEDAGLARVLAPCRGEDAPDRAFDVMIALLAHPGLDERSIALRRELQAVHPGLLASYLARLGSAP